MINEIYIDNELVTTDNPKKKFKNGYKIRCVCCGELIERKSYDKKVLETPYKCKPCVLKHNNPMYNSDVKKKHNDIVKSKEYRDNMKKATLGEKNGFYGKTHTKETMDVIKEKIETYWETMSDEVRDEWSRRASLREQRRMKKDPIGYRKQKAQAARISHKSQFENCKMNNIETTVYDYLIDNDIEVTYSVILASYQYDFGIKDKRILIEVDGDYWHGNPKYYNKEGSNGKKKLNEIQLNKIDRDKEKTEWATSRGFTIIRLWEDEINNGNYTQKLNSYIDEIKKN